MNKYNIITLLLGVFVAVSGFLYVNQSSSTEVNVGTELPEAVALFESSLAAPITADATSMTLTSNSVRGGGSLSGYNCFTIDEGSAQAEFVCGTASSTSVTGLLRGISPSDGITEDADLKFSHRRGASVKITDFPIIQLLRAQNNGDGTFENVIRYASDVVPVGADDLADVGYVLSVVNGGAVTFDRLVVAGRAGETVATGTLVYFNRTDQEWYKVSATNTSTFANKSVGLTQGSGVNAGSIGGGGVLLKGRSTVNSGLVAGSVYYASTSGAIATTSSIFSIGETDSTSVLYFDPVLYDVPRLGWDNTFTGTTTFTGNVLGIHRQITYTASSTYTKPDNVKFIKVQLWGAGGSGGRFDTEEGAGGGGGAYAEYTFASTSVSSSTVITIGAGGISTTADNQAGQPGGYTSFGNLLTAYGGAGGGRGVSGATGGNGGGFYATGTALTGINGAGGSTGVVGGDGYYSAGGGGDGFAGGNSFYGGGGGGGTRSGLSGAGGDSIFGGDGGAGSATGAGTAGSVPGGGGGGSRTTSFNSGKGADGMAIITEYY